MCKQIWQEGPTENNRNILYTNRKLSSIHFESVVQYQEVGQKPAHTAIPKNRNQSLFIGDEPNQQFS